MIFRFGVFFSGSGISGSCGISCGSGGIRRGSVSCGGSGGVSRGCGGSSCGISGGCGSGSCGIVSGILGSFPFIGNFFNFVLLFGYTWQAMHHGYFRIGRLIPR